MKDSKAADSVKKKKSFAERRQTITVQMEKMIREVRSKYRKRFIFVIALLVLIIVAFIVYAIISTVRAKDICKDEICYEIAENMYKNMDLSVDPCEDFYLYTCGGWIKNNPRPEKEDFWSILSSLRKNVMKRLKDLMENDDKTHKVSLPVIKAQNFFKSCSNTESRDKTAMEGLQFLLRQIGGYPLIEERWNDKNYDWESAIAHLQSRQSILTPLFSLSAQLDYKSNYTKSILSVGTGRFDIGRVIISEYYKRSEKQEAENKFRNNLKQILRIFGVNITTNTERAIDREIDAIIEFEESLARAEKNTTEEMYQRLSARNVSKHLNFDLEDILRNIMIQLNFPGSFDPEDTIIIENIEYLKRIGIILKKTPKRTIANYIGTRVITMFGKATITKIENLDGKSYKDMIAKCYWTTEAHFRLPIHQLYIDTYFKPGALDKLREFVKHLKASLTLTLQMNDWMDDVTKLKAQLKLNKMLDVMATPTNESLIDYYADLGYMESNNYFANYMKIVKFQAKKELSPKKRMEYGPSTVNAFYSPYRNRIEVTPGILQPPVYYTSSPIAMNFAAIGTIIGHEITHGFDDSGSQYDAEGRYKNWWANETREKYDEKVKCFVDQYSKFTEPKTGLKVNGNLTIGDNIADNGGLHQSYRAYKLYAMTEDSKMDLRLPGDMSQFTPDQLFFISYANLWCENNSEKYAKEQILYDPHAPNRYRSIVPLSNSEEFADAFHCKSGTKMNPTNKCLLW